MLSRRSVAVTPRLATRPPAREPDFGNRGGLATLGFSNQIDNVQQNTTVFPSTAAFVNTLRASYCSIQGTPGLHSFLRASSSSVHTQFTGSSFNTASIGGTLLRDWLGDAMTAPGAVVDKTANGTLQTDYPRGGPVPVHGGVAERRVPGGG